MTQLEDLQIGNGEVTVRGIESLAELPQLRNLRIEQPVMDSTLDKLNCALPNCHIVYPEEVH